jgi:hypothetical protein
LKKYFFKDDGNRIAHPYVDYGIMTDVVQRQLIHLNDSFPVKKKVVIEKDAQGFELNDKDKNEEIEKQKEQIEEQYQHDLDRHKEYIGQIDLIEKILELYKDDPKKPFIATRVLKEPIYKVDDL